MQKGVVQSPMKISGANKSSQGQNSHFHAWKFHIFMYKKEISCMKLSCLDFFIHEIVRTGFSRIELSKVVLDHF